MNEASRATVKKWMVANAADCVERSGPRRELNTTQLAENAAHAFDHDEWLDDGTHWVWDIALEVDRRADCWDKD